MTEQEKQNIRDAFDKMVTPVRFGPQERNKDFSLQNAQTIYDEDYLRVIVSPAFRRLQDKAQVYPLEASDFVRTRLTHSLEVSFFGHALGMQVEKLLFNQNLISKAAYLAHAIPCILKVVGLIHDIGNTPFGHFGEQSIQAFYREMSSRPEEDNVRKVFGTLNKKEKCDLYNFDGNVQGLRVVTKLASAKHTLSLHLSKPVISTMIKYPKDSKMGRMNQNDDLSPSKFGYFDAEKNEYKKLNDTLGLASGQRHPLTYLLEAADDIAYSVSDIEDGFNMKALTIEDIQNSFKAHQLSQMLSQFDIYRDGRQDVFVQLLRLKIQDKMVSDCANYFVEHFHEIITNNYNNEPILESSQSGVLREVTKEIAARNFNDKRVIKHEILGGNIIKDLLELFAQSICDPNLIISDTKLNTKCTAYRPYLLISNGFKYVQLGNTGKVLPKSGYGKFLLINDFISGMTDSYALRMYKELISGDIV